MANETVYRFVFEDEGGSSGPSPAPASSRPVAGAATAAAQQAANERSEARSSTAAGRAAREPAKNAKDSLGTQFVDQLTKIPVFDRLATILAEIKASVRLIATAVGAWRAMQTARAARDAVAGAAERATRVVQGAVHTNSRHGGAVLRALPRLAGPVASGAARAAGGTGGRAAAGAATAASAAARAGAAAAAGSGATGAAAAGGAAIVGLSATGVGLVAAAALVAVGVAGYAAGKAMAYLDGRIMNLADRIGKYSGVIAAAQARQQALDIIADVRSAQRSGRSMGNYIESRGELGRSWQRVVDSLDRLITEGMTPLINVLNALVSRLAVAAEASEQAGRVIGKAEVEVLKRVIDMLPKWMGDILKNAIKIVEQGEKKAFENLPPEADILGIFGGVPDLHLNFNGKHFGGGVEAVQQFPGKQFFPPDLPMG